MRIVLTLLLVLSFSKSIVAEDLATIFENVNKFVAEKNYSKALDELNWAINEVTKMQIKKSESFFPEKLDGLTRSKIESNAAMGMVSIKSMYSGKDSFDIELIGGSNKNSLMGGLAGLGKMAGMFGGIQNPNMIRIKRRSAHFNQHGNNPELTVFLDSGYMLKISSRNASKDAVQKVAESFPLDELDQHLKG